MFGFKPKKRKGGRPKTTNECGHPDKPCQDSASKMCANCYRRHRYHTDEEFRERLRETAREHQKKYKKGVDSRNPGYYALKQREYRKRHPERFVKIMARSYLKRLPHERIAEILEEIGYEKEDTNQG